MRKGGIWQLRVSTRADREERERERKKKEKKCTKRPKIAADEDNEYETRR